MWGNEKGRFEAGQAGLCAETTPLAPKRTSLDDARCKNDWCRGDVCNKQRGHLVQRKAAVGPMRTRRERSSEACASESKSATGPARRVVVRELDAQHWQSKGHSGVSVEDEKSQARPAKRRKREGSGRTSSVANVELVETVDGQAVFRLLACVSTAHEGQRRGPGHSWARTRPRGRERETHECRGCP